MSPEERFKFDFLATLVHEGIIQPLADWLQDAPPWTEEFVIELVHDGLIAVTKVPPPPYDQQAWLSLFEAQELLASENSRTTRDLWLVPTPEGSREFDESNARAMFDYCAASTSHLG